MYKLFILYLLLATVLAVTTVVQNLQSVEIVAINTKHTTISYNFKVDAPAHISGIYTPFEDYGVCNISAGLCKYAEHVSCLDVALCNISNVKVPYAGVLLFYNAQNIFAKVDYSLQIEYDTAGELIVDDEDDCAVNMTDFVVISILAGIFMIISYFGVMMLACIIINIMITKYKGRNDYDLINSDDSHINKSFVDGSSYIDGTSNLIEENTGSYIHDNIITRSAESISNEPISSYSNYNADNVDNMDN